MKSHISTLVIGCYHIFNDKKMWKAEEQREETKLHLLELQITLNYNTLISSQSNSNEQPSVNYNPQAVHHFFSDTIYNI